MKCKSPGVDFTNVLQAAFVCADPKSTKRQSSCQSFFVLLGSAHAKAAHRMLMKLSPDVNFTNILYAAFTCIGPKSAKRH